MPYNEGVVDHSETKNVCLRLLLLAIISTDTMDKRGSKIGADGLTKRQRYVARYVSGSLRTYISYICVTTRHKSAVYAKNAENQRRKRAIAYVTFFTTTLTDRR